MERRRKRSRYEIIRDVLNQCETDSRKTWVMYRANLSYELVEKYLEDLEKLGLVESKDGLYHITDKGRQVLDLLNAWKQKKDELDNIAKLIKEYLPEERRKKDTEAKEVPAPAN
jgi:predicted transcriptional regulator